MREIVFPERRIMADDGFNLVYHEFAHALDMTGGVGPDAAALPQGLEAT